VIFGEHTEKLCELLKQDYNIVGQDRTLEAATASVKGLPDLFLVTGTALASGLVEGDIKHGMALLTNLKKLRSSCPESRIVIILANKKLTKEIAKLGIYDIHVTEDISIEEIKGFLKTRKSFADCDVEVTTNETPGKVNVSETSTPTQNMTISSNQPVVIMQNGVEAILNYVKKPKKPVTIINACPDSMHLPYKLGITPERTWQHDWRIRTAMPFKVNRKVEIYTIDRDDDIEKRDAEVLKELINLKKNRQIIINTKEGGFFDLC